MDSQDTQVLALVVERDRHGRATRAEAVAELIESTPGRAVARLERLERQGYVQIASQMRAPRADGLAWEPTARGRDRIDYAAELAERERKIELLESQILRYRMGA
jgi:hypothetical protein